MQEECWLGHYLFLFLSLGCPVDGMTDPLAHIVSNARFAGWRYWAPARSSICTMAA